MRASCPPPRNPMSNSTDQGYIGTVGIYSAPEASSRGPDQPCSARLFPPPQPGSNSPGGEPDGTPSQQSHPRDAGSSLHWEAPRKESLKEGCSTPRAERRNSRAPPPPRLGDTDT